MLLISSILFANEKNLLIYTATVAEIRSAMSVNADANIGSMMKMKANLQWIGIRKNFSNSQVKDFFMGALQLSQNSDKDISIQALYNPWLDSMLLMKLSISENKAIVDDIMILSGETFRNEKYLPTNVEKMLSTKEPLVVSLWRNVDSTRRIFEEKFKTVEDSNSVYSSYKIADKNEEIERFQIRSATRMQLFIHLKNDKTAQITAQNILNELRNSSLNKLKRRFTNLGDIDFLKTFSHIPNEFRDFILYQYISAPKERLYLFTSKLTPRIFVVVNVQRRGVRQFFQWYDLNESTAFLKAWEDNK